MGRQTVLVSVLSLLLVVGGCITVSSPAAEAERRSAHVTHVVDGDTLEVRFADGTAETVRLLGVDAPEIEAGNEPGEFEGVPDTGAGRRCLAAAGADATDFVERRVEAGAVTVVTDPAADRRGDYGRLLAYVELPNGTDLNHRLVETGLARVYDSRFIRSESYDAAEADARAARRGLWRCREPPAAG